MGVRNVVAMFLCISLAAVLLAGCATPTQPPPLPQPPLEQPQNPPPALPPINTQPVPPPPFVQPARPIQQGLFRFIETIQVTPDDQYLVGGFSRINYVPATDHFVVTFGGELARPSGACQDHGYSYKEYTLDMEETGKSGTFSCDVVDAGSAMVESTYYFAAMARQGEALGWHLLKIDAANWATLVDTFFPVDYPKEGEADPMVSFVNGQVDISSGYNLTGNPHEPSDPDGTFGSHHQLFSPDLKFLERRILTEPGHVHGSYMVFVDGVYYLVTADSYQGDVIVAQYDTNWRYLGGKTLIKQAHFSTGLVFDGERFYLAYTDTSQRTEPGFFPVYLNIHLAAFDRGWNLIDDVAVTDYPVAANMQTGRPWVILHGNRLYVSYDLDTMDPVTRVENLQGQAIVSVYELAPQP